MEQPGGSWSLHVILSPCASRWFLKYLLATLCFSEFSLKTTGLCQRSLQCTHGEIQTRRWLMTCPRLLNPRPGFFPLIALPSHPQLPPHRHLPFFDNLILSRLYTVRFWKCSQVRDTLETKSSLFVYIFLHGSSEVTRIQTSKYSPKVIKVYFNEQWDCFIWHLSLIH